MSWIKIEEVSNNKKKSILNKIFNFFTNLFTLRCPKCKGEVKNIGTHKDKMDGLNIYECQQCKNKFI